MSRAPKRRRQPRGRVSSAPLPRWVGLTAEVTARKGKLRLAGHHGTFEIDAHPTLCRLFEKAEHVVALTALQRRTLKEPIAQLLEAGALTALVPGRKRFKVRGTGALSAALQRTLDTSWVAPGPVVEIQLLGTLGSPAWRKAAAALSASGRAAVPISFEREFTWVGPATRPGSRACPTCLALRREPISPQTGAEPVAAPTRRVEAVAAAVLSLIAARAPTGEARFVTPTETSSHRVVPDPACTACFPPSTASVASQADAYGAHFAAAWERPASSEPTAIHRAALYDPMLASVVRHEVRVVDGFRDLPLVIGGVQTHAWREGGYQPQTHVNNTNGSGFTLARRDLVQLSEGLERLALLSQRPDVRGVRAGELGALAVDPDQVTGFSEAQRAQPNFPFVAHQGQALDWSFGCELATGKPRLVPFDAVAVGRAPEGRGSRLMDEPFFTGGATHVSLERATSHALLELIERDAFMLAWYLRLPLPQQRVDFAQLEPEVAEALRWLEARRVTVRFYDLAVDFAVPTVLAIAQTEIPRGRWVPGGKILSGCAASTAVQAIGRCVSEVLGQVTAVTGIADEGGPGEAPAPEWLGVLDRYLTHDRPEAFAFLGSREDPLDRRRDLTDGGALSQRLSEQLAQRGLVAIVRPMVCPEADHVGLAVAKVVVPTLLRPARSRAEVNFGSPRLASVAAAHGVPLEISPHEHPLA